MDKESFNGLISVLLKEILMKTILKAVENTNGQMEEFITVNGLTIRWKGMVLLHGLMAESISVNIKTIKNTAKVLLNGLMEENT